MIDFERYKVLSFDCYGTLIDWENGILSTLRPLLKGHDIELADEQILGLYAELEAEAEEGEFVRYREVLRRVVQGLGVQL
ncbi:MAG: haloacid dehalogenase, partial [Candidatus Bipolaricaulia bacterium]